MVLLLLEAFWEFHDSFVPSETAGAPGFLDENDEGDIFRETVIQDHEPYVIS